MGNNTLRKFKFFLAWEDEKEEHWLNEMALSGWKLISIIFPGIYVFEAAPPANTVYRLDFNTDSKNVADYLGLFEDAGWEHVTAYGSWHYFRIAARPGEAPEIFSDNASKIAKYQRVMLILVVLLPLLVSAGGNLTRSELLLFQILAAGRFVFTLLYIYAVLMLLRRISQLKRLKE